MNQNQTGFTTFSSHERGFVQIFITAAIMVVILGSFGYLVYKNSQIKKTYTTNTQTPANAVEKSNEPTTEISPRIIPTPGDIANWKTYNNEHYGLTFKYPPKLTLEKSNSPFYIELMKLDPKRRPEENYALDFAKFRLDVIKTEQNPHEWLKGVKICPESYNNKPACTLPITGVISNSIEFEDLKSGLFTLNTLVKNNGNLDRFYMMTIDPDIDFTEEERNTYYQILSTFNFFESYQETKVLDINYSGGLCPDNKVCGSYLTILKDGRLERSWNQAAEQINKTDIDSLISLIDSTDFENIRSKEFTGTCPTAYDGQEATYTFYTQNGTERVSSCQTEIDYNSPLFSKIEEVVNH